MTGRERWLGRLHRAAPDVPETWLRILAAGLGGATTIEGLMIYADTLRAGARDAAAGGGMRHARELWDLADLIDREIAWRSPTLSLPRRA